MEKSVRARDRTEIMGLTPDRLMLDSRFILGGGQNPFILKRPCVGMSK